MKTHFAKILISGVAVLVLTALAFVLPLRPSVSMTEKRTLAEFPDFSFSSLADGSYFSGISSWFSDTFPGRDSLINISFKIKNLLGVSAADAGFNEGVAGDDIPDAPMVTEASGTEPPVTAEPVTVPATVPAETEAPATTEPAETSTQAPANGVKAGETQALGSIIISGNAGYEYYNFVQETADRYISSLNNAAAAVSDRANVYDMIIPTSIDIVLEPQIRESLSVSDQRKAINYMYASMSPAVKTVDIFETLAAHKDEYIYFRADHHWTGLGAYYAYTRFCVAKGIAPLALEACTLRSFDGFLGSFYNDSGRSPALAETPDRVDTYTPPVETEMTVTDNSGNTFVTPMIYNAENNQAAYKYSAFIYGDNAFTKIENLSMTEGESCLLVKESFGNAIAPLLTYHYKYVYVLDYRYCSATVSALVDRYGITDVLYCNNISMTRSSSQVESLFSSSK